MSDMPGNREKAGTDAPPVIVQTPHPVPDFHTPGAPVRRAARRLTWVQSLLIVIALVAPLAPPIALLVSVGKVPATAFEAIGQIACAYAAMLGLGLGVYYTTRRHSNWWGIATLLVLMLGYSALFTLGVARAMHNKRRADEDRANNRALDVIHSAQARRAEEMSAGSTSAADYERQSADGINSLREATENAQGELKIMLTIQSEMMVELRERTVAYRRTAQKLLDAGALDTTSVKSHADLTARKTMVVESRTALQSLFTWFESWEPSLRARLAEQRVSPALIKSTVSGFSAGLRGSKQLEIFEVEAQLLDNFASYLGVLERNWGHWKAGATLETDADFPEKDNEELNKLVDQQGELAAKQADLQEQARQFLQERARRKTNPTAP